MPKKNENNDLKSNSEAINIELECEKKTIDKIFSRALPFVEDMPLSITKEGLHTCIVDVAHVALYDGYISKKEFTKYKVNIDTRIGITLTRIGIPLSLAKDKLAITYDGKSRLKINNYKHGLVDVSSMPDPKMPNLEPCVEFNTDKTETIKRIINIASKLSDHFAFIVDENKQLWLNVEGDIDELNEPLGKVKELRKTDYPVRALYSVDYMKNILKDLSDKIILRFSADNPIQVIEEKENEKHVFLLAPRIESE